MTAAAGEMKLAVIGDPVSHSASPALHRAFMADAGVAGSYEAIRVAAGDGARAVDALRAAGYFGLNVTTPLKEEAYACAPQRDAAALASRAANTLVLGSRIWAYNTDGAAAFGALREAGLAAFEGAAILVLGAGPTARAVVATLGAAGADVRVWNRTAAAAAELAARANARVFAPGDAFAAAVSALPPDASLRGAVREAVLRAGLLLDANYGPRATLARELGRPAVDGLRMLQHGAKASFDLWLRCRSRGEGEIRTPETF